MYTLSINYSTFNIVVAYVYSKFDDLDYRL